MADRDLTLGLLLAGGLSRRMGGGDKALLALHGKPMLAHAIERLAPQCAALVVNANGDASRFAAFGLPVVADDPPDFAGPLAGVLAGLDHARANWPGLTHVVSLAADTPFAPPDLVARLRAAQRQSGRPIAVAQSGGRTHNVVALWPVEIAPLLRHALVLEGQRKVESFQARCGVLAVAWPDAPVDPFFNVNTPEDLAFAEREVSRLVG